MLPGFKSAVSKVASELVSSFVSLVREVTIS